MIHFSCDRQTFHAAITSVSKGVSAKSTIPELECLKMKLSNGTLELTGYDLEFGIRYSIEAVSDDEGEFVIEPNILKQAVGSFAGERVDITLDDNFVLKLTCEETQMSFSAMSAADYPSLPELSLEEGMSIAQATLASMIRQTSYAASVSEAKPILTGQLFEAKDKTLTVAAIDGYRLAVRQEPIVSDREFHFVVPKKTLTEVASMLRDDAQECCTISADRRSVVFEFGGYVIFSRLLEGEFHNYRASIPDTYTTEIVIDTLEMTKAVRRCSLVISTKSKAPVECTFSGQTLSLWCKTEVGEISDKIPAEVSGPDILIGFDNMFLLDALKAADCDKIRIQLTGKNRVAKILPPEGESFLFLLMPVQLKNR